MARSTANAAGHKFRDRSRHQRARQVAIVTGVGCLIGLSVLLTREVRTGAPAAAAAAGPSDEELHTGSILYMPLNGRNCRQLLFDNISGRLADNGLVDCERAAYHPTGDHAMNWSVARTNVISKSFRKR